MYFVSSAMFFEATSFSWQRCKAITCIYCDISESYLILVAQMSVYDVDVF